MKVFISYTLRDGEVQIGLLKAIDRIGSLYKLEIFIDKLHNNDSNPQRRIEKEIQSSDVLMLIESTRIFQSEWVRKEILLARDKHLPIYLTQPNNIIKTIKTVYNNVYSA